MHRRGLLCDSLRPESSATPFPGVKRAQPSAIGHSLGSMRARGTEGRMPRIRTRPALLALLALAAASAARSAPAEDCLAGPNAQAPAGSHWYYRLDRATHRKGWYIGAQSPRPHPALTGRRATPPP